MARMRGRKASTARWLNAWDTNPRMRLWSGSSREGIEGSKASIGSFAARLRRGYESGDAFRGSTESARLKRPPAHPRNGLEKASRVRGSTYLDPHPVLLGALSKLW